MNLWFNPHLAHASPNLSIKSSRFSQSLCCKSNLTGELRNIKEVLRRKIMKTNLTTDYLLTICLYRKVLRRKYCDHEN